MFQFPLHLRFRILTIGNQIHVTDASEKDVFYIEEKVFAIRESIKLYESQEKKQQLYGIKTNKVIDIGAEYFFYEGDTTTTSFGSLKEQGLKSIVKASYQIRDKDGNDIFTIVETNPWVKLADLIVSFIPYADLLTGYFLNPTYDVIDVKTQKPVLRLRKERSFWERQFILEEVEQGIAAKDHVRITLGIIMMILLQRERG